MRIIAPKAAYEAQVPASRALVERLKVIGRVRPDVLRSRTRPNRTRPKPAGSFRCPHKYVIIGPLRS
jgi:hypothetical protein